MKKEIVRVPVVKGRSKKSLGTQSNTMFGSFKGSAGTDIDTANLLRELEASKEKAVAVARLFTDLYVEIYNFSPAGYFRLDNHGRIVELNVNGAGMLRRDRNELQNRPFHLFISEDSQSAFFNFFKRVFNSTGKESCEIKVLTGNGPAEIIRLEGIVSSEEQKCLITAVDITEHKHLEAELRASGEMYRKLHESLRDGYVYVNMDGKIEDSNTAYQNLLGYTAGELKELSYFDLTPEEWHGIESEIVKNEIMKFDYSSVYLKEYRKKDGSIIPVELRTFLIRDNNGQPQGMWAIVRDITERKIAENALRESEENFRNLFENSPMGMSKTGMDGSIYINHALSEMLGYPREELRKKTWMAITHPEDIEKTNYYIRSLMNGDISMARFEKRFIHSSGDVVWVFLTSYLQRDKSGQPKFLITLVTNITEQKKSSENPA